MRNSKIIALAFFAAMVCGIAFADLSVTGVSTTPASIRPGVVGAISMTISNPDVTDALGVVVEAYGTSNINAGGQQYLGDFKSGAGTVVTYPFSVPMETNAGIYTAKFKFTWTNQNGSRFKTMSVPLTVGNPAIFSVQSEGNRAFSNDDITVRGKLYNDGGRAKAVRIAISSSQFIQTGQTPLYIGDVDRAADFAVNLTVAPGVSSGSYSIPVLIYSRDEVGQDQSSNTTLRILVSRRAPDFSVAATPDRTLTPGSKAALTVELKNVGDDDAYSVRVSLPSSKALTPLGQSDADVGTVAAGASKRVGFDVGVNDVPPGFYEPAFIVKYRNRDGDVQADRNMSSGINVEGKNDVSVFISAKPTPLAAGGSHTLSVLVSNIGSSPVKALTVKIDGGNVFQMQEAQDTQFIGGLSQDDFSTVQYKVRIGDAVKDGEYPVNVTMTFKDAYNRDHTISQAQRLKVLSKESAALAAGGNGSAGMLAVTAMLAVIAVAAVAVFLHFRSRQKKKD